MKAGVEEERWQRASVVAGCWQKVGFVEERWLLRAVAVEQSW